MTLKISSNMMTSNSRKILTFSGRMRSGKDMLCQAMEKAYGAKTFSLATHLKELCCKVLEIELPMLSPWNNANLNAWKNNRGVFCEEGIEISMQSLELISSETGFDADCVLKACNGLRFRNVRELLQLIGTDVIRSIDSSWHVRKTLLGINALPESTLVCIDDIRFPNELEAFRNVGADSFFVIRNNAEIISRHESENSLFPNDFSTHRIIVNNGTPEALCKEFVDEYSNGFKIVLNKPILLSDCPDYRDTNLWFASELTPIVEETIRQNRERDAFVKDGLITFRNNTKFNLKELLDEMKMEQTYKHKLVGGRFVIDNPVAYENLKRWL